MLLYRDVNESFIRLIALKKQKILFFIKWLEILTG
jgi:hypothetical protein